MGYICWLWVLVYNLQLRSHPYTKLWPQCVALPMKFRVLVASAGALVLLPPSPVSFLCLYMGFWGPQI